MNYKKLLEVQKKIKPIVKGETNPFFNSKYADINSVLAVIRPILNEEGLVVVQPLKVVDGKQCLGTYIVDAESGEDLTGSLIVLPEINDPQKMGAAITYYRRYALVSIFCLEQEDDDGNSAVDTSRNRIGKPIKQPIKQPRATINPTLKVQPNQLPPCEVCNAGRKYMPPGISKAGFEYDGFYPCTTAGCNGKPISEDLALDMVQNRR